MMSKQFYTSILASKKNGTIYIGVTSNIARRVWEHKNKTVAGFTKKYSVDMLVYYEVYNDINEALKREKRIKKWNRNWKIKLIESKNPDWTDLYEDIVK